MVTAGIEAEDAAAMLGLRRLAPESRELWGDWLAELELGRQVDELSARAFRAWRQRWWRQELGRGRRLFHFLRAALAQAHGDLVEFSPMPLGAARGTPPTIAKRKPADRARGFWAAAEPKTDGWLVTFPIFERMPGALIAVEILAWRLGAPHCWWRSTGALAVLGRPMAEEAMCKDRPVRVYKTPQSWNRAGGGGAPGCCILDWEDGTAVELLHFATALIGDDRAHARDLQRRVDTRRKPRVRYVARGGAA